MDSPDSQARARAWKQIASSVLVLASLFLAGGCRQEETTPQLLSAAASFACDARQGFFNSSEADAAAIRREMDSIDRQIKDLQAAIASRQQELAALPSAEKSDDMVKLELDIQSLQVQIAALQDKLATLQNQLKALQEKEKSEQATALENEIRGLKAQLTELQSTLQRLQQSLNDASYSGQNLVGYIEQLSIGGLRLTEDLSVIDPVTAGSVSMAGVLNLITWEGGYSEPILFSCQVSAANQQQLAALTSSGLDGAEVVFAYSVYAYDQQFKAYFKCFHTNSIPLKGLVTHSGGTLSFAIDANPSGGLTEPPSYTLTLGITPQPIEQELHLGMSSSDRFVKTWGVAAR